MSVSEGENIISQIKLVVCVGYLKKDKACYGKCKLWPKYFRKSLKK
jgi:hypothetical protein